MHNATAFRFVIAICFGVLLFRQDMCRAVLGQQTETPKFNYGYCTGTKVVACQSCFPVIVSGVTCGNITCACGLFRLDGNSAVYTMCQQDDSASSMCQNTNNPFTNCTGGGVWKCGCCTNCPTCVCSSSMCSGNCTGNPDYTGVIAPMGNGCVNL